MPYGYRFREQLDRICEFLFTNSGMAFCDESLRAALEITRTMVPARYLSKRAANPGKLSGVCVPVTKRKLAAKGKNKPQIVTAIGRELLGFIWAIAVRTEAKFQTEPKAA